MGDIVLLGAGRVTIPSGLTFNVKSAPYNAVGDGVTDDTAALAAAVADAYASFAGLTGSDVIFPAGTYGISTDFEVPIGVKLHGSGSRSAFIKWISGSPPTDAVMTSNLTGQYGNGFAHDIRIEGISILANGEAVGAIFRGWNETCTLDDFEVWDFTARGLDLEAVTLPATNLTQHTSFRNVRLIPDDAGTATHGLRLRGCRRCFFQNVTVDSRSSTAGPCDAGFGIESGSDQNVFVNCHSEDCTTPYDIGAGSQCVGNVFLGCDFDNPHADPALVSVGSIITDTIGVLVRTGSKMYSFNSIKDAHGYDWMFYDEDRDLKIAGKGDGGGVTYRERIDGFVDDANYYHDGVASRREVSINATTYALDVTAKDSASVVTSAGDVTLGGLSGGVKGQQFTIFKKTAANALIIKHNDGAATERIQVASRLDINLTGYGGVTVEFDGSNWFVVGDTGTSGIGIQQLIASSDATPLVTGFLFFRTLNAGTTSVTNFDGGTEGQQILVEFGDRKTTIDFTSSFLRGNAGVPWSPLEGDWMRATYSVLNGGIWLCEIFEGVPNLFGELSARPSGQATTPLFVNLVSSHTTTAAGVATAAVSVTVV